MGLATIDVIVVVAYAILIFGLAQWVSREKGGKAKDTSDYFLASKNLVALQKISLQFMLHCIYARSGPRAVAPGAGAARR